MLKKAALGLAMLLLLGAGAEACTVIVVTKGASEDGSMMVSHSNDGYAGEVNLAYVPAKDHPAGSMRPVYASAAALGAMPEYNTYDQPNLRTLSRRSAATTMTSPTDPARGRSAISQKSSTLMPIWTPIMA